MISPEVLGTSMPCTPSLGDCGGTARNLDGAVGGPRLNVDNDKGSKHMRRRYEEDDIGDDVSIKEHQVGKYRLGIS